MYNASNILYICTVCVCIFDLNNYRLQQFISQHRLKMCGEHNAGYGGKCVTQSDINELWNLCMEVGLLLKRSMCTIQVSFYITLSVRSIELEDFRDYFLQRVIPLTNHQKSLYCINGFMVNKIITFGAA